MNGFCSIYFPRCTVKFTPANGRVEVRAVWADNRLSLSVTDTGIGISASEQETIFQRFRQVEGSSTRRFEGTGLGLALVKELAGLLDGTISVDSVPGHGSRFTLNCAAPAVEHASLLNDLARGASSMKAMHYTPMVPPKATPVTPASGPLPKVLVAEDNAEMAAYIATLLSSFCETRIAPDGDAALAQVRTWTPDLLLTDVMMPGRDGLSLCREMKASPATAEIPIVDANGAHAPGRAPRRMESRGQ